MTLPRSVNNKYAGTHRTRAGTSFIVFYISGQNAKVNRANDSECKFAGWYWRNLEPICGPFSSSRAAYRDAIKT